MSKKSGFEHLMSQMDGVIFHPLTLGLVGFAVLCALIVITMNNAKTGKSNPLKFSETAWLNYVYWFAIFFAPILAIIFVSILAMLAKVGIRILTDDTTGILGQDNLRWYVLSFVGLLTALGGIIGTPLALIRVYTTERQTKTAEQGHITDRINKAVEGLGSNKNVRRPFCNQFVNPIHKEIEPPTQNDTTTTFGNIGRHNAGWFNASEKQTRATNEPLYEEITIPNIEVRIGAIYSLERIAQDSLRDHVQIMEILCTYIRENSPAWKTINQIRTDIATALTIIGRRTEKQKAHETLHRRGLFSLHGCNLQKFEGRGLDFSGIDFSGSWLNDAVFFDCNFSRCHFEKSKLKDGAMIRCSLDNIEAKSAILSGRMLPGSTFRGSYLFEASFDDCRIDKNPNYGDPTDFSYASIVNANFENVAGYDNIKKTSQVFSNEQLNIKDNAELDETGLFEMLTKEDWIKWKKSHGYTSEKIKP